MKNRDLKKLKRLCVSALTVCLISFGGCQSSEVESETTTDSDGSEERHLIGTVTDEQREKWFEEANNPEDLLLSKVEKVGDSVNDVEVNPEFKEVPDSIIVKPDAADPQKFISAQPDAEDETEVMADFNFKNAPIPDVVPVFSTLLGFNYAIEGNLTGTVTMSMHENITRGKLREIFFQLLRLSGVVWDVQNDIMHLRSANAAPNENTLESVQQLELGIFRLQHVSTSEVVAQIKQFLPRDIRAVELPKQNTILILDSAEMLGKLKLLIDELDRPANTNLHRALFLCRHIKADQLAKEIREILPVLGFPVSAQGSRNPGEISLTPLTRLQALVVSSADEDAIQLIEHWIKVLDCEDSEQEQLFIYEVVNGRAEELARAISTMYNVSGTMIQVNGSDIAENPNMNSSASLLPNENSAPGSLFDYPVRMWTDAINQRISFRTRPRVYASLKAFLQRLDTIPSQVLLQVLVVEINLSDNVQFGVEFNQTGTVRDQTISGGTDYKYLTPGSSSEQYGGKFAIFDPDDPEKKYGYINALTGQSNVRVISSPQVLITNNHKADMNVGDEVPIITAEITNSSSASSGSTSLVRNVVYRETGISLTITPKITRGGRIDMTLSQTVSEAFSNTTSGIDSPMIQKRVVETNMSLKNGQLLVCGGLIREKVEDNLDSLPLIINIPFLRRLVGDTNIKTSRTEMLVLITGTIVTEESDLQKMISSYRSAVDSVVEFSDANKNANNHKNRFNHSGDLDKWFLE